MPESSIPQQRLKSFSVTLPFPLTASTVTPFQRSIAKNAARISRPRAGLLFTGDKMSNSQAEMPKYQCHKKVWALKIQQVYSVGSQNFIVPADYGYDDFPVSQQYIDKHKPQAGGYYVQYEDGYESFSPADVFESGYSRI